MRALSAVRGRPPAAAPAAEAERGARPPPGRPRAGAETRDWTRRAAAGPHRPAAAMCDCFHVVLPTWPGAPGSGAPPPCLQPAPLGAGGLRMGRSAGPAAAPAGVGAPRGPPRGLAHVSAPRGLLGSLPPSSCASPFTCPCPSACTPLSVSAAHSVAPESASVTHCPCLSLPLCRYPSAVTLWDAVPGDGRLGRAPLVSGA